MKDIQNKLFLLIGGFIDKLKLIAELYRRPKTLDISSMRESDFRALPSRKWGEDIGEFDSLIILPSKIGLLSAYRYKLLTFLNKYFSWIKKPEIYDIKGMHDSGYRLMDFVAVKSNKPICLLSGCSDVIHLDGIGGYGKDWFEKYNKVPELVKPSDWNMDCLPTSGLLRLFARKKLTAGSALSSFEIFTNEAV